METTIAEQAALLGRPAQLRPNLGIIMPHATGSACCSGQRLSHDTPAARSSPVSLETRDRLSLAADVTNFCEKILPALFSMASASSRFSLLFSSSSARRHFASRSDCNQACLKSGVNAMSSMKFHLIIIKGAWRQERTQ